MDTDRSEILRRNLVEAATLVLEHEHLFDHVILENFPGGVHLKIQLEVSRQSGTGLRPLPGAEA